MNDLRTETATALAFSLPPSNHHPHRITFESVDLVSASPTDRLIPKDYDAHRSLLS